MFVISRSYRYDLNVKNTAPLLDCLRARTHFLVKLLCSIVILLAGLIRSLHEVIQTILLRCMYSAGTTTLHLNTCSVQPACTQAITRPEPGSRRWRSARHCDLPGACLPQCVGFKGKGRIKYMGFILKGIPSGAGGNSIDLDLYLLLQYALLLTSMHTCTRLVLQLVGCLDLCGGFVSYLGFEAFGAQQISQQLLT